MTRPTEPTVALDYAPPPPILHRRRVRQVLITGAIVFVAAWASWRLGAGAFVKQKLAMRAAQQRVRACMVYQPPPNQVVWDETPSNTRAPSPPGAGYRPLTRRARASWSQMPRDIIASAAPPP